MLVKTISDKNKQSLICCLFLAYFVCYAISPLSLTFTAKKIAGDEYAANDSRTSYSSLRIFLLELICSRIDEKKDAGQSDSKARVLIRKARAVLRENVYSRFLPARHWALHDNVPALFDNSSSGLLAFSNVQATFFGFNNLHSGLSPPSA